MSICAGSGRRAALIPMVCALLLGGCAALAPATTPEPAPTPVVAVSTVAPTGVPEAPTPSAPLVPTATPAPESTSTAEASVSPCEVPGTTTSYYCVDKNGEGFHGGAPIVELPNAVAMDYRVSGTCRFSLSLATETSATGLPSLTINVSGPPVVGTWHVKIKHGRYYPAIGEAVGCVYHVNIRDDR